MNKADHPATKYLRDRLDQMALERLKETPNFVLHTADINRQRRRALIKAVGIRQFKRVYRGAQA